MKAQRIQKGDYIVGFGRVAEVHRYDNDVADRKSSVTNQPKMRGPLLGARLVAEAQEHAYDNQLASITFRNMTGQCLSRRPDDQVQVYTTLPAKKAAAAA